MIRFQSQLLNRLYQLSIILFPHPYYEKYYRGTLLDIWIFSHIVLPRNGRLGFLTNIFTGGVIDPGAAGRGFLILDWLRGELSAREYLQVC